MTLIVQNYAITMKKTTPFTILLSIIGICAFIGCTDEKPDIQISKENNVESYEGPLMLGDSVLNHVRAQLAYGPRNPGSKGHSDCMEFLLAFLKERADTAFLQPFSATVYGKTYQMANIVASFSPEKSDRILLCAHWDTRPISDEDNDPSKRTMPILGANDGASGVAVLMGIAEILSKKRPDIGVDIMLFDGEDLGLSGDQAGFFQGSRYAGLHYPLQKPRYGILLDLVGDKDAEFRYEPISQQAHSVLVNALWSIAKKRQSPYFIHEVGNSVSDDHVILNEHGIRTINIIDVNLVGNFGPNQRRKYWHTSNDVIDNLSSKTLEDVGNTLLDFIFTTADSIF